MPTKHSDLHGNAPDTSAIALVLIDVMNDMEFEGGADLLEHALPAARNIAALKKQAKELGIPVIYANDNFGRWRSDFREVVAHVVEEDVRGRPVGELLKPDPDDYFVLKPKHSAFFGTTLDVLLDYLEVERLILTGFSGDICVLFTASDAYMRDLHLSIPSDCIASASPRSNKRTLAYMEKILDVDSTPSTDLDLRELRRRAGSKS